jgi:hypothetical protein
VGRDPRPRTARFARDGAERATRRGPCQLTGGSVLHGERPHYKVSPGLMLSDMVRMDCPSQRPHGSQLACHGSSGAMMTRKARSVAQSEVAGG